MITMIKLDLHVHSHYSEDAIGTPEEIIKYAIRNGMQGIAITDHNTVKGGLKAEKIKPKDFTVIPGVEISTKDGHLLALNVRKDIPAHKPVLETIDLIKDEGGVPIVPHLFRNLSGIKKDKLKTIYNHITAIEVYNGCSLPKTNLKTSKIAKKLHLGGTGGSDTHEPIYAGYAYTIINSTDIDIDTILDEINRKKTWGEGKTLPLNYRRDRMITSIKQFFQRGFKRI